MSWKDMFRNQWYRRIFLSYLALITVLICLMSCIFYAMQMNSHHQKHMEQNAVSIHKMNEYHRLLTNNIENLAVILEFDERTAQLSAKEDAAQQALQSYDYMSMLSSMKLTNELIDSIWVYDSVMQLVYTSERTRLPASHAFFAGQLLTPAASCWLACRPVPQYSSSGNEAVDLSTLTYVHVLRSVSNTFKGYIYMNISAPKLVDFLLQGSSCKSLTILDQRQRVVYSPDLSKVGQPYDDPYQLMNDLQAAPGNLFQINRPFSDEIHYVTAFRGDSYIYIAESASPNGQEETAVIALYAIAVMLSSLIIGAVLCMLLFKRMYNPFRQLVRDFESRDTGTILSPADSSLVRDTLNTMADRLEETESESNQPDRVKTEAFELILHNQPPPEMIDRLESFDHFIIILGEIDEPAHHQPEAQHLQRYFERLLRHFLRSILLPGESTYTIYMRDGLSAAAIRLKNEERYHEVDALLERLQQLLQSVGPCTVSFACSQLHHGEENLSLAIEEAQRALRFKIRLGMGSRIFYDESMKQSSRFVFPQNGMQQVLGLMDSGSLDQMKKAYRDFMGELRQSPADMDDLMLVFNQLLSYIIRSMMRRKIAFTEVFTEPESSPYRYLNTFDTMERMADWILEKLSLLYKKRADQAPGGNLYINAFRNYMNEHYMERLDPEQVAEHLGISYSYMRKLLNSEMNTSFSAYLLNLRLHYTRNLLIKTNISQREIAERVGFGSEQTLYRVFKQNEGCSPGEFRKKYAESFREES